MVAGGRGKLHLRSHCLSLSEETNRSREKNLCSPMLGVGLAAEPVVTEDTTGEEILGRSNRSARQKGIRKGKRGILSRRCHRNHGSDLNKWFVVRRIQYQNSIKILEAHRLTEHVSKHEKTKVCFIH